MAADGKVQIDIDINSKAAQKGLKDVEKDFDKLGAEGDRSIGRASNAFGGLGRAIGIVGGIIAGAAIADKIKDFGIEAVKAAASAQALSSQFSQVFGELETQATAALASIGDETSILPERLKGSFVQIAAFAKTAGFDNASALDLSTRATLAAADSAAFYDKSIESVTETLQSYLKGKIVAPL